MTNEATTIPSVHLRDLEREHLPSYQNAIHEIGVAATWFMHNETEPHVAEGAIISAIQSNIRKRLQFSDNAMPWDSKEKGNCYSFTWHTSLALEEAGINHYIAYTNGHAYCLAVGKEGDLYMVNTDQPAMNDFEMPSMVIGWSVARKIIEGFDEPSLVTNLHTDRLSVKQEQDIVRRRQAKKKPVTYPWIAADAPVTTIMQPEYGRMALFNYAQFSEALNKGDATRVEAGVSSLAQCNPQQETREQLNESVKAFKKFVKNELINGGEVSAVLSLIEKYCAIMPDTFSMRIHVGDLYRLVANYEKIDAQMAVHLADRAKDAYISSIMPEKGVDPMRRGKIAKCIEIVRRSQMALSPSEAYV